MKHLITCIIVVSCFFCCNNSSKRTALNLNSKKDIICNEDGCEGTYEGPEFIYGDDIAHQFSNSMSRKVGDKLKELYEANDFKKVDFSKIKMTTVGMGSGNATYYLSIPFNKVKNKCDAYNPSIM